MIAVKGLVVQGIKDLSCSSCLPSVSQLSSSHFSVVSTIMPYVCVCGVCVVCVWCVCRCACVGWRVVCIHVGFIAWIPNLHTQYTLCSESVHITTYSLPSSEMPKGSSCSCAVTGAVALFRPNMVLYVCVSSTQTADSASGPDTYKVSSSYKSSSSALLNFTLFPLGPGSEEEDPRWKTIL